MIDSLLTKLKKKYLNQPYSLPWEEWEEWDKKSKKEHPIAFFLLITLPAFFGSKYTKLTNLVWWFKHRLIPKHKYHLIDTGLSPEYYDIDIRMLHGCFSLLLKYVEEELPHASTVNKKNKSKREVALDALQQYIELSKEEDYDDHVKHYEEIRDLYLWWTDEYLKRDDNKILPYDEANKQSDQDTEMLVRLVKIRGFLWT